MSSLLATSVVATLIATVLAFLSPQTADAGPLSSASLTIDSPSFAPSLDFPASGATGFAASPTSVSLGAGSAFNGTATALVLGGALPVTTLQVALNGNGAGNFSGTPLAGTAPFSALLRLQAFGGFTITTVPFVLGQPGTVVRSFILPTAGSPAVIRLGLNGWTAGTTTVLTTGGIRTAMGSNNLSPAGAGTLSLVSPIAITAYFVTPPARPNSVAFANLELRFLPEPGTLTLALWGGATCLALAARRRQPRG